MREPAMAMKGNTRGNARYRLVVRGELDARYGYLFDGMRLECVSGTTVLTGDVRDQAQLHGFIERVEELGLELLEVQQVNGV
jgi:hypothetical protein